MAKQTLNIGTNANDGTGDNLRAAMQKVNENFTDLYSAPGISTDTLTFAGNEITAVRSNDDIVFKPAGTGAVLFPAIMINDNNIEGTRSNEDINLLPSGTGSVVFGAISISGTTFSSSDSATININEGLVVDGTLSVSGATTFSGSVSAGSGTTIGNLTLADGSITDSSGAISFGNENLTTTGTITAATGSVFGTITVANGSITDSTGAISFGDENLSTTGTIAGATGSTLGNLTLSNGSITDSSGAISFGNENLSTTGTLAVGNVTLSSGSIVDSSGAISFGNENLTSTGTINSGTGSTIGNLTLANGSITDSSGAISFGDENLTTTGSVTSGTLTLAGASITDSSGEIDFGNENLTTTGTLDVSGLSTLGALTVTGATTFGGGGITIDNLILNDNTISSSSNADINLTPGGTGVVTIPNLTVDSNINITDNTIKTTVSNSDLQLSGGSGSGIVEIIPGLVTAAVTTVGNVDVTGTETITGQLDVDAVRIKDNTITTNASNANLEISANGSGKVIMTAPDIIGGTINNTVIGGSTPAAGTFTTLSTTESLTIDGITISDNTISTNASNANLELSGSGSGGVRISGFTFPTSHDTAGKFLTTNGLGVLSFATAGVSLSHSDLADATTTISSSATSVLNTFDKTVYRSAKYFISATDATNSRFELLEANVIHDGTTAYLSTFGSVSDYTTGLGTYTVGISGDDVQLKVTNITDNSIVFKFQRIAIDV